MASEEKRVLKVIKGGLTSTMENMSNALAAHFPDPKKVFEKIATKSYAAVLPDPSNGCSLVFTLFEPYFVFVS